jgi:hypothetical protein
MHSTFPYPTLKKQFINIEIPNKIFDTLSHHIFLPVNSHMTSFDQPDYILLLGPIPCVLSSFPMSLSHSAITCDQADDVTLSQSQVIAVASDDET